MSWIATIDFASATGRLEKLYKRVSGPERNVDNIMQAHSLRPHTMEGHMVLYKNVLHHAGNTIPKWFLEALGVYTSMINACDYCVEHHFSGLCRLVPDKESAMNLRRAMESDSIESAFAPREAEALEYAARLTLEPETIEAEDLDLLREVGWEDGEILEINQVVAYFNYANRTVLGLGVSMEGDVLGLSPGDSVDPDNWSHA